MHRLILNNRTIERTRIITYASRVDKTQRDAGKYVKEETMGGGGRGGSWWAEIKL